MAHKHTYHVNIPVEIEAETFPEAERIADACADAVWKIPGVVWTQADHVEEA